MMEGALIHIELPGLDRLERLWARLTHLDERDLLEPIGAEVETQTRRRLQDEKTSPEGAPWPEWSEQYARTRHSGHSLLQNEGDLTDSILQDAEGDQVLIGSNLVYAATHQFGDPDRNIPERPYLGLSPANLDAIETVVEDWLNAQLGVT